jgi:hypothetical protein
MWRRSRRERTNLALRHELWTGLACVCVSRVSSARLLLCTYRKRTTASAVPPQTGETKNPSAAAGVIASRERPQSSLGCPVAGALGRWTLRKLPETSSLWSGRVVPFPECPASATSPARRAAGGVQQRQEVSTADAHTPADARRGPAQRPTSRRGERSFSAAARARPVISATCAGGKTPRVTDRGLSSRLRNPSWHSRLASVRDRLARDIQPLGDLLIVHPSAAYRIAFARITSRNRPEYAAACRFTRAAPLLGQDCRMRAPSRHHTPDSPAIHRSLNDPPSTHGVGH